jgi:DNA replication protein DnaC
MTTPTDIALRKRALVLGLHGLLTRWDELSHEPWLPTLLDIEEAERQRRSLERRLAAAKLNAMKPIADFDWKHPKTIDRTQLEDLFELQFMRDHVNIVLLGPNGVGKTMLAQNLAHHAVMHGFTARFTTASAMLGRLRHARRSQRPGRRRRAPPPPAPLRQARPARDRRARIFAV